MKRNLNKAEHLEEKKKLAKFSCIDCDKPTDNASRLCLICAEYKKCKGCKLKLRRVRFENESDLYCITCTKKKDSQTGGAITTSVKNVFRSEEIPLLDDNSRDLEICIKENSEKITQILTQQLQTLKLVVKFFILQTKK